MSVEFEQSLKKNGIQHEVTVAHVYTKAEWCH